MLTEAIHTPLMQDRYLAIENAKYIFNNCRHLGDEVEFKKDGIIQKRAQEVLGKADDLLAQVEKEGLFSTIEKGIFGGVSVRLTVVTVWKAFAPRVKTTSIRSSNCLWITNREVRSNDRK